MTEERLPSKFTFILHADIAGSTVLVQQDEDVAHKRIQDTFRRFSDIITQYHGHVRELRGDALLAEFERASDALTAALVFQKEQSDYIAQIDDDILPTVRVGIAMGEVIIADDTITGEGVVLAQRVEQIAEPGGVCITGAIQEALPTRLPFDQGDLGEQQVKGFDNPVRVYTVKLKEGADLPEPTVVSESRKSNVAQFALVAATVVLICGGALLAWVQPWQPDFEPASVEKMALPLPDKPSIAVLPFDNLSDDEKLDIFISGLTENITSALAKISGVFVVAGDSAATYKGKSINVKQVAEELGIQYVLEGSVQKSGDQLRITTNLVDAIKGHHLWAHRFDRPAEEVFAVQDEITKQVFIELQVELTEGEHARIAAGGTDSLEAWLLRIEAYNELIKWTRESHVRALELYRAAHEADPNWAWPVAGFTWIHHYEARRGWSESREESIRLGTEAAERAIALQPEEWIGYAALSNMKFLVGETEQGIELGRKAIELAPGSFAATANLAFRIGEVGRGKEAVNLYERAARLSPKHPWWIDLGHGFALHLVGRKEEAITVYQKAIDAGAISAPLRVRLAAAYVDLGQMDKAKVAIEDALSFDPGFTIAKYFAGYPVGDREAWYRDLLIRAGLPEHPPLELPDKPSIAVLPFDAYSDESEQKHFASGLTEDLITTLSRVPDLLVIARTSTQKYKGKQVDVREVAKELGVGYILEGSIQKSGDTIRINAQLIDGVNGNHIWAKKYDRPATDFFAIQDDIVRRILVEMHVKLIVGDHAKVASRGTKSLDAWLLGRQAATEGLTFTAEGMVRARQLFQEARETDPNWSRPLAGVAWTLYEEARRGWSKSREESIDQGIDLAKQAIEMDPEDPFGYMQ
ncbi:MAG: adenylate/guanylate cyclase domain-containing protein, partial [Arenicellales bacterium]|nr:adenylate/guanylate cyclase domain-containing protein [Arenicellales bacterium]